MFVEVNNVASSISSVDIGVPQGTILGPYLFIIYVNDIVKSSDLLRFNLYADDTTLCYSHYNLKSAFDQFNLELEKFYDWTRANKILIHFDKTKYTIFTLKPLTVPALDDNIMNLKINDNVIEYVSEYKYLGVFVDSKLNFKSHINHLSIKLSKVVGILRCLRYLPTSVLKLLYFSMFFSVVNYCILIWGSAPSTTLTPLFLAQKKAIRIASHAEFLAHTDPLFKELNTLKLDDIFEYNLCILFFKILNLNHLPYFKDRIINPNRMIIMLQELLTP